jgi:tRNA G10  N-methylase Trm11
VTLTHSLKSESLTDSLIARRLKFEIFDHTKPHRKNEGRPSLTMANLLRLVIVAAALRQIVIIRSQSRHTYGFEPFDLPLLELEALTTSEALQFEPVDKSGSLLWADGVDRDVLATAASQAILTHAAFEISDTSVPNLDEVATIAAELGCEMNENTQVVDMTNPNMSRTQRLKMLVEAGVSMHPTNNSNPKNAIHPSVLLRREDGHVHIGWRTATGPAAVGNLGAPGTTKRRNYNGVLGKFALKNRLHLTQTAMEPEIAFIMASLSRISHGSKVLDPCCGSAGLLLCAAARGASHLVGVDRNGTAFVGAHADFEKHGLPSPTFVEGDVLQPHRTLALCQQEAFDVILCDPPYNIGAPVLVDGQDGRLPRYHEDDEYDYGVTDNVATNNVPEAAIPDLTAGVLDIARQVLVVGGRVVFFLPVRGYEAALPLSQILAMRECLSNKEEKRASGSLKVVHGRLQRFSPTFSRWLISMERVR